MLWVVIATFLFLIATPLPPMTLKCQKNPSVLLPDGGLKTPKETSVIEITQKAVRKASSTAVLFFFTPVCHWPHVLLSRRSGHVTEAGDIGEINPDLLPPSAPWDVIGRPGRGWGRRGGREREREREAWFPVGFTR